MRSASLVALLSAISLASAQLFVPEEVEIFAHNMLDEFDQYGNPHSR
jgi:hypothetical protein